MLSTPTIEAPAFPTAAVGIHPFSDAYTILDAYTASSGSWRGGRRDLQMSMRRARTSMVDLQCVGQ